MLEKVEAAILLDHLPRSVVAVADAVGLGIIVGAIMSAVPPLSALLALAWFGLRVVNEILEMRHKLHKIKKAKREDTTSGHV